MRILVAMLLLLPALSAAQATINVGSKRFTESYILGEIIAETVRGAGEARAAHQQGLGNTAIVFTALRSGIIDLYPEYTGTIAFELLKKTAAPSLEDLNRELAPMGLGASTRLGFNNTYALAMLEERAARFNVRVVSDLKRVPDLKFGLSQEFLNRRDGWPAMARAYGVTVRPRGLDHGLAYEAVATAQVDVIDVYSTDAKIDTIPSPAAHRRSADSFQVMRPCCSIGCDLPKRFPKTWEALQSTGGPDFRQGHDCHECGG